MKTKCDVCGKETDKTYVAASAYGPVSYAYCEDCLHLGREPYYALVVYIAGAGHFPEDIAPDYVKDVRRQLAMCGINEEKFIKDVEDCMNEMYSF